MSILVTYFDYKRDTKGTKLIKQFKLNWQTL